MPYAVAGGFAAFGLAFLAAGVAILVGQRRFRQRSVMTQGVIVAMEARESRRGEGLSGPLYHPVVEFVTGTGQRIVAATRTGSNPAPGRVGQAVGVRYDPASPERFSIPATTVITNLLGWVFTVIGVAVFGISCVVLVYIVR